MPYAYRYKKEFINALGGGDVLIDVLLKKGLDSHIDKMLGKRSARAEYKYSDGVLMWFIALCSGSKRMENVYNHKERFTKHPRFNKFISPDSLLYMFKELAVDNDYWHKKGHTKVSEESLKLTKEELAKVKSVDELHEINWNPKLNNLLVESALKLKLLQKGVKYTLDWDTTLIETKIRDSRIHYKKNGNTGYAPALGLINNIPLVIENRNGNSNGHFNVTYTIEKTIDLLNSKGIEVGKVRVDAAGFSQHLANMLNKRGINFYIRPRSNSTAIVMHDIFNWKQEFVNNAWVDVGDAPYMFGKFKTRMIVEKKLNGNNSGLITNDFEMSNDEAINFYAQRGDAENLFKNLKQDFGWDLLPMRSLKNNTVYFFIEAFCYQLYKYIVRMFAGKLNFVRSNMCLWTFIQVFMKVPTMWDGHDLIFCSSDKDYSPLAGFT